MLIGEKVASKSPFLVFLMWLPLKSSSLDHLVASAACEAF
jgi:hypothetical protein